MGLTNGYIDMAKDGVILSAEQKSFYEKNGYLVVPNLVPQHQLERFKKRFQEICDGAPTYMTIMRDITIAKTESKKGERAITKIQDFNNDPVLFDYCQFPSIVNIVRDLIGTPTSNIMSMHTMLINKPPDTGSLTSRHPMHQDLQYFPFRPADYICCAWTAMEKVTRENGCLVVEPGTHKGELLPHDYPKWEGGVNKAYHGIVDYDVNSPRLHMEMEAGDTIFFHPLLIHGSGVNRSQGFRKAISCHYANDDLCKYIDVTGTTGDLTGQEIIGMAKRHFGHLLFKKPDDIQIDFPQIWRLRARSLQGTRVNL